MPPTPPQYVEVHSRDDGGYDWRLVEQGGGILDTSGGLGFASQDRACEAGAESNPGLEVRVTIGDEE